MLTAEPASIRLKTVLLSACKSCPTRASRNENSAETASRAPVRIAVRAGVLITSAITAEMTPLARMIRNTVTSSNGRCRATKPGSTSIPTETKKRPAKISRSGMMSPRIWCERSDSPTTIPATKAPSASDSPKKVAL